MFQVERSKNIPLVRFAWRDSAVDSHIWTLHVSKGLELQLYGCSQLRPNPGGTRQHSKPIQNPHNFQFEFSNMWHGFDMSHRWNRFDRPKPPYMQPETYGCGSNKLRGNLGKFLWLVGWIFCGCVLEWCGLGPGLTFAFLGISDSIETTSLCSSMHSHSVTRQLTFPNLSCGPHSLDILGELQEHSLRYPEYAV